MQNDPEKMMHYLAGTLPLPKKNLCRWPQDLVGMRLLSGPRDYHYHAVVWSWVRVWYAHLCTRVCGEARGQCCMSFLNLAPRLFFEIVSHQTWNSLIVPGCQDQWASEVYCLPSCQGLGCRYSAFFMSTRASRPGPVACPQALYRLSPLPSPKWKYSTQRAQAGQ